MTKKLQEEWDKYLHLFKRSEVPARTILLREGEVSKQIFFVERGSLRVWFNNHGEDVTFQFFLEGELVSAIESFYFDQPSLFNLESIEHTQLRSLSKQDLQGILAESTIIKEGIQELAVSRLLYYQKLFLSRIKDKPQERYRRLLIERPDLVLRVPQHYLASYLGITPVSLSRIRNRK